MKTASCSKRPVMVILAGICGMLMGCARQERDNRVTWVCETPRARTESSDAFAAKAAFWYPLRDVVTLDPVLRGLGDGQAWNVNEQGGVADSSFYTNRDPALITPQTLRTSPAGHPAPLAPFSIVRRKKSGSSRGFVGQDARGRTFLFKFDHPEHFELGTGAEVIGSRIMWLLGYHVSPSFIVMVSGTGTPEYDGHRASALPYIKGEVLGHFPFDWFRHRREFRAARLACAWINETDRSANNGLVVMNGEKTTYYLIDFNSALGSWNGVPKEPWQGRRHRGDVAWDVWRNLFHGWHEDGYDRSRPNDSPQVGRLEERFDPRTWRANLPNTAFDRMTREDAAWIIHKMAAITDEQIRAIVDAACYTDPAAGRAVRQALFARRETLLSHYGWSPASAASSPPKQAPAPHPLSSTRL